MKKKFAATIALSLVLLASCAPAEREQSGTPRNLILLISDGCGPTSFTMTREYGRLVTGDGDLALDPFLIGTVRTHPSDTRLADSAAAATAFACGVKTKKGYVGVDTTGAPVGTLLEAAEHAGFRTGLITTSGITDATPAAFSAHNTDRYAQTETAAQQLRQGIEVLLGGGRSFFQSAEDGGVREDGNDQIKAAIELGYEYVSNREELLGRADLPLLGLFAADHMALEIDRDETDQPSLSDMFGVALELLSDGEEPFILVAETEGTDDAGHDNDAAANLREILSYEETFRMALDFARRDGGTLLIATSDHDTGGLAIGTAGYEWSPEVLTPIQVSASRFASQLSRQLSEEGNPENMKAFIRGEVESRFGLSDLEAEFWGEIDAHVDRAFAGERTMGSIADLVKEEISRRAGLGWSTSGHTGVDVNLYAFGPGALGFRGNQDNTAVGRKLAETMHLDLDAVTDELRATAGE
jgi:alkaline phosphatase